MGANELKLKQLIAAGKARVFYIGGTGRSGSTIMQIIFAKFVDRALHQPFKGLLAKARKHSTFKRTEFDADIYEQACGLIVEQINQILPEKAVATILVKELADFFAPPIWQRWLEIPEKFLFTINDPHLQYLSGLSLMVDAVYQGNGALKERREFVLDKASLLETKVFDNFDKQFKGTIIEYNDWVWQKTTSYLEQAQRVIEGTTKKLGIIDLVLLRHEPEATITQMSQHLDLAVVDERVRELSWLEESQQKIVDVLDRNRLSVRKATESQRIYPLQAGEAISLAAFPPESRQHIIRLIPQYLAMLYGTKQIELFSLEKSSDSLINLAAKNPFVAYAIAKFYGRQNELNQEEWQQFQHSWAIVDRFWQTPANPISTNRACMQFKS